MARGTRATFNMRGSHALHRIGRIEQAPHSQGNTAPVSEDCLYLNVWIHGGGYVGGSTSIGMSDGTGYARKGVVLVRLAYRLGPYGFLAHPELSRERGQAALS